MKAIHLQAIKILQKLPPKDNLVITTYFQNQQDIAITKALARADFEAENTRKRLQKEVDEQKAKIHELELKCLHYRADLRYLVARKFLEKSLTEIQNEHASENAQKKCKSMKRWTFAKILRHIPKCNLLGSQKFSHTLQ